MDRIRLCLLITELRPAGAERCVYELARRLDRARFDVRVAALRGGAVADALQAAGVPTHVLGVRGKWDAGKLLTLARLLRQWRIELLHTHLFHADVAGRLAACMAGVPHLVHTVHVAEERFRPWQFAWARLAAGRCDRIVCVSGDVADWHAARSGLPMSKYRVIHNGVDVEAFATAPALRRWMRSQWAVADDRVVAVFAGRLDRQKGVDVLLRAMERLGASCPRLVLLIAGEGPQREGLERLLAELRLGDRVRMLGFVEGVERVLAAADLFVMPSRWEGFGLAAAEAMAAGLPVVATRVAGLREIVLDGHTGILVDRDDAAALAEAIQRLAGDAALRGEMGRAGAQRVAEHFDIRRNVEAHQSLYREVARGANT